MGYLRQTIHKPGDLVTKVFTNGIEVDQGVFHDIVKQTGGNTDIVEAHFSQNIGNLKRMNKIRLA